MRILHITPFYAPAWAYGGIPRAVSSLARAQYALPGIEVEVATTDVLDARHRFHGAAANVHYFKNVCNSWAYNSMLLLPMGFRNFLEEQLQSFDIVHLHGCRHLLNEIFVRRPERPPYVLSPHGTLPRIETKILLKGLWDRLFGRGVVDGASRVLALTSAEATRFEGIDSHRIRILPNIVEDPASKKDIPLQQASFASTFGINSPYLLYLGKLTPRKHVDTLLQAFSSLNLPDVILVIAGNDMGSGSRLRALSRELSIEKRVSFTGLLIGRHRREALAGAELLVYPGEHEVFGLVPFEGLFAGVVPIVSDDSGCGELIQEGACGYRFHRGDALDLTRVIAGALHDRHGRSQMIQRAQVFLRRFAPESVAETSLEIYREALRHQ